MALSWPFTREKVGKIGRPFTLKDVKDFSDKFRETVRSDKQDSLSSTFLVDGEVRNGEFFGIESIDQLIKLAREKSKTVAGIRVYYGLAFESIDPKTGESKIDTTPIEGSNDSSLRPRLFLVAVDEEGKDIDIDLTGFKDVPDGSGFGNGSPQPPFGNG